MFPAHLVTGSRDPYRKGTGVCQLTDIAGPRIVQHEFLDLRVQAGRFRTHPLGGESQVVMRQQQRIVAALTKRRQHDAHGVQAVEQVGAKRRLLDSFIQGPVGRRNDAHVHATHAGFSHTPRLALLQHTQQLHLQQRAGIADLIEEQRAAVSGVEQALAIGDRPREGAATMPKQFALDQGVWGSAAVVRHEPERTPATQVVERPRNQFLAGAGFSQHQDRQFARGNAGQRSTHAEPGGRCSQQLRTS